MAPEIALLTAGVEMDVLGIDYEKFNDASRDAVVSQHPRSPEFKEDIIEAFWQGIKGKPQTTFGNVKADVIRDKEAGFVRVILQRDSSVTLAGVILSFAEGQRGGQPAIKLRSAYRFTLMAVRPERTAQIPLRPDGC